MPTRCPYCGTYNKLNASGCSRCSKSLDHITGEEHKSLRDVRAFGIIFLITMLISVGDFVLNLLTTSTTGLGYNPGFTSVFNGIGAALTASDFTDLFLVFEIVVVVMLFVQCISFIYLRSSFVKLGKFDVSFSTPSTGTGLLIAGIILSIIGLGAVIAFLFPLSGSISSNATPTAFSLASFGAIALGGLTGGVGVLLLFIGYIIGVLLGLHRLSTKFEETYYDYALVLIVVSLFFTPLGLIAAILILIGTRRSAGRLKGSNLGEMMAPP